MRFVLAAAAALLSVVIAAIIVAVCAGALGYPIGLFKAFIAVVGIRAVLGSR